MFFLKKNKKNFGKKVGHTMLNRAASRLNNEPSLQQRPRSRWQWATSLGGSNSVVKLFKKIMVFLQRKHWILNNFFTKIILDFRIKIVVV